MKYGAVIFDLFGTVVDNFSYAEHERVVAEMAAAVAVPHQEFLHGWRATFVERATGCFATTEANIAYVCQALGSHVAAERLSAAARIRLAFTERALTPRVGALETLSWLKAAGYKTGLISDCSSEVPALWQDTPFAPLIDAPIFSCAVGCKKPDPRIYQLACERLAVMPPHCLYVGDGSSHELTGASQVGMQPVLIRVAYEDTYDTFRIDAEDWPGPTVSALEEVLRLVQ